MGGPKIEIGGGAVDYLRSRRRRGTTLCCIGLARRNASQITFIGRHRFFLFQHSYFEDLRKLTSYHKAALIVLLSRLLIRTFSSIIQNDRASRMVRRSDVRRRSSETVGFSGYFYFPRAAAKDVTSDASHGISKVCSFQV